MTHSEAPARISARTKGQDGGGAWTTIATGDTAYVRADLADGLRGALENLLGCVERSGISRRYVSDIRREARTALAHYREATDARTD